MPKVPQKIKILKKKLIFSEFKNTSFYLVNVDQLKKAGCIFQLVDVNGRLFLGRRQAALFITPLFKNSPKFKLKDQSKSSLT